MNKLDWWAALFLAIPIAILANLLTPKVQAWAGKTFEAYASRVALKYAKERKRIFHYAAHPERLAIKVAIDLFVVTGITLVVATAGTILAIGSTAKSIPGAPIWMTQVSPGLEPFSKAAAWVLFVLILFFWFVSLLIIQRYVISNARLLIGVRHVWTEKDARSQTDAPTPNSDYPTDPPDTSS